MHPIQQSPDAQPPSASGKPRLFVVAAVILLSVFGLLVCAGALSAPFVLLTYRREAQRAENQRAIEQAKAAKMAADAAALRKPAEADPAADPKQSARSADERPE
jgi:hypothetical protein